MGGDTGSLPERMAEAARELQDHQDDPQATFRHAVELACANVEGCDAAGLSFVRQDRHVETVAATDEMVVVADRLQYEISEGPCLDSIWESRIVHSRHIADDKRWPVWGPRVVAETAARSILAFRLFTHGDTLGALNLYSCSSDGFHDSAEEEGLALAAHIATAVAASQQIHQLVKGLDTRTYIGQATGILMERFDLDGDAAFKVLARYSSTHNVKLRDVAAELIRTRALPNDIGGHSRTGR